MEKLIKLQERRKGWRGGLDRTPEDIKNVDREKTAGLERPAGNCWFSYSENRRSCTDWTQNIQQTTPNLEL